MLDEARIGFDNSDYHLHRHIPLALQSILIRKYFYLVPEKKYFEKIKIEQWLSPDFQTFLRPCINQIPDIPCIFCMVDEKEIEILKCMPT